MERWRRGFSRTDLLVLLGILNLLGTLVYVLGTKLEISGPGISCPNNLKNLSILLEETRDVGRYPHYAGANLILYLVQSGEIKDKDLDMLFCPDAPSGGVTRVGGIAAYKHLDLTRNGQYDRLTSYAARDFLRPGCQIPGEGPASIVLCDQSFSFHRTGIYVALSDGRVVWRDKTDDYDLDSTAPAKVGKDSKIRELRCLRSD